MTCSPATWSTRQWAREALMSQRVIALAGPRPMIADRLGRYGGHDPHAKIGRHGPRPYSFDEITHRLRALVIPVAGRASEQMPPHQPAASWVELAFHVGCDQAAR